MRAGPLSDARVIQLLNAYFVPYYTSKSIVTDRRQSLDHEWAASLEILNEARENGMSGGTVHVYILSPDGPLFKSSHVGEALRTPNTVRLLEEAIAKFQVKPGSPLAIPTAQCPPPSFTDRQMNLHIVTRSREGEGGWPGVTEDWLQLEETEWRKLYPAHTPTSGQSWEIDAELAKKLLIQIYPPSANNDPAHQQIEHLSLQAEWAEQDKDRLMARVVGRIRMRHDFHAKDQHWDMVDATLVGYMVLPHNGHAPPQLYLMSERAKYGNAKFSAALHSPLDK